MVQLFPHLLLYSKQTCTLELSFFFLATFLIKILEEHYILFHSNPVRYCVFGTEKEMITSLFLVQMIKQIHQNHEI